MRNCRIEQQTSDSDNSSAKDDAASTTSSENKDVEEAKGVRTIKKDFPNKPKIKKFIGIRKDVKDPLKFTGEGISFKAKLIGIDDVSDIRGDRMCQESLQKLKKLVKDSGQHKQKVTLNVSLEGIKIKEEKTGDLIHHHPVHKISFISQDITDRKAFGYVFGSPEDFHQFIGIKTEKTASQVVIVLRDLFQFVLDLKRNEMAKAQKLHQQQNRLAAGKSSSYKEEVLITEGMEEDSSGENIYSELILQVKSNDQMPMPTHPPPPPPLVQDTTTIGDLLGLQIELDSLQLGIQQMDDTIAVATTLDSCTLFQDKDPFASSVPLTPMNMEPLVPDINPFSSSVWRDTSQLTPSTGTVAEITESVVTDREPESPASSTDDRYSAFANIDGISSLFDNPTIATLPALPSLQEVVSVPSQADSLLSDVYMVEEHQDPAPSAPSQQSPRRVNPLAFAELDPLGKGRPYVDKKDFFCEIKHPPKKVMNDLIGDIPDVCPTIFMTPDPAPSLVPISNMGNLINGSIETEKPIESSSKSHASSSNKMSCLPPKSSVQSTAWDSVRDTVEHRPCGNPFNPFKSGDICKEHNSHNASPPLPVPKLPTRASEPLFPTTTSPPPRPPSRNCSTPTPPLPRKKGNLEKTWISFVSGYTSCDAQSQPNSNPSGEQSQSNIASPPIPIPARKLPVVMQNGTCFSANKIGGTGVTAKNLAKHSDLFDDEFTGNLGAVDPNYCANQKASSVFLEKHGAVSLLAGMGNQANTMPITNGNPRLCSREESLSSTAFPSNPFSAQSASGSGNHTPPIHGFESKSPPFSSSPPLPPRMCSSNPVLHSHLNFSQKIATPPKSVASSLENSPIHAALLHPITDRNAAHSQLPNRATPVPCTQPRMTLKDCKGISAPGLESHEQLQSPLSPEERNIFRRKSDPFADDFFTSVQETCETAVVQATFDTQDEIGKGSA